MTGRWRCLTVNINIPPPLKPSNQEKMIDNKKKKYQVDYMATEEAIPM
jgi:hypothetical protein